MASTPASVLLGVCISLLASAMDAAGLNIQRKDHLKHQKREAIANKKHTHTAHATTTTTTMEEEIQNRINNQQTRIHVHNIPSTASSSEISEDMSTQTPLNNNTKKTRGTYIRKLINKWIPPKLMGKRRSNTEECFPDSVQINDIVTSVANSDEYRDVPEYRRPMWLLGFALYIISQVAGNSLALIYLQPVTLAPLGAASMLFNLPISKWLLKTKISKRSVAGTFIVIVGVIVIAIFGEEKKDQSRLNVTRSFFIVWFGAQVAACLSVFIVARVYISRYRGNHLYVPETEQTLRRPRIAGLVIASIGGIIGSMTLLVAHRATQVMKKLHNKTYKSDDTITDAFVVSMLLFTGVFQVYCLNFSLKLASPVSVVPLFFASYTTFVFLNANAFFDSWTTYSAMQYCMVFLGIIILMIGIRLVNYSPKIENEDFEVCSISDST